MKKLKIAVLMGGPSAEHEVSLATGKVVLGALDKKKYDVKRVEISKTGKWSLSPDKLKADAVFIAMHGTYGEDGTVQGFLEAAGLPYTGSGILASALAMDKVRSMQLFAHNNLEVPQFYVVRQGQIPGRSNFLSYPCVVKPSKCGSSVGISIVRKRKDLSGAVRLALKHDTTAIVQEYKKGDEVTCAVIEKDGRAIPLQPTQIIPKISEFFDYKAKYAPGGSEEITPPRLPAAVIKRIQGIALRAHDILGCRGMSRTDMIVSKDGIYVLETNTIPGMTETSLLPQAAEAAGVPFPKLLDLLITSALNK